MIPKRIYVPVDHKERIYFNLASDKESTAGNYLIGLSGEDTIEAANANGYKVKTYTLKEPSE